MVVCWSENGDVIGDRESAGCLVESEAHVWSDEEGTVWIGDTAIWQSEIVVGHTVASEGSDQSEWLGVPWKSDGGLEWPNGGTRWAGCSSHGGAGEWVDRCQPWRREIGTGEVWM